MPYRHDPCRRPVVGEVQVEAFVRQLHQLKESNEVNRKVVSLMKMGTNHLEAHMEGKACKISDLQLQLQLNADQVLFTILISSIPYFIFQEAGSLPPRSSGSMPASGGSSPASGGSSPVSGGSSPASSVIEVLMKLLEFFKGFSPG